MRQILQDLRSGKTRLSEVPCPSVNRAHLLVRTSRTLISAGTERMLVEFGRSGLLSKARQQPEKVRLVLDKIRSDGFLPTIEAVQSKLDAPLPMGYCNVGEVLQVGAGVLGFKRGDRVACNGPHAEVVAVPSTLCARVPDAVSDEAAAFTVIGAIALQGIRLAQPTLGERFVVIGLGLVGLLAVQLLRANGCEVLGVDPDCKKLELARAFGAQVLDLSELGDPSRVADRFSAGRGVDGVLVTASTKSSEPVHQAAQMCRKRGRIVLVGVVGLELSRADFYEKELTFQVSCSYGPGRYDPSYEEQGHDYPLGFVRWTEQRNFEAVLGALEAGQVDVRSLVTHRFSIGEAEKAYTTLTTDRSALGILLTYPSPAERPSSELRQVVVPIGAGVASGRGKDAPAVGFIGAGNYAGRVLMGAFRDAGANLHTVASARGVSAVHTGRRFTFRSATTAPTAVIEDQSIDAVVVVTRHDTHARFVCEALRVGKHVFVEKPLCLSRAELAEIDSLYSPLVAKQEAPVLTVGFNRRFAPHVRKMKALLEPLREPKSLVMVVNAGEIPREHWTQDPSVGGGRIIGEACHFVDLLRFLAGHPITAVQAAGCADDTASFTLDFEDGSVGTVHYFANGHKSFPKERLEVFCAGRILQLDNFRRLTGYGWPGFRVMRLWRQDKGQTACAEAFLAGVQGAGQMPIPYSELLEVTRVTLDVAEALAT